MLFPRLFKVLQKLECATLEADDRRGTALDGEPDGFVADPSQPYDFHSGTTETALNLPAQTRPSNMV